MVLDWQYWKNRASLEEIYTHLMACNETFSPPLNTRVDIPNYAKKIAKHAVRIEAWSGSIFNGLIAIYCNNHDTQIAHITHVSVLPDWTHKGIASDLLQQSINHAKNSEMRQIHLEVAKDNKAAVQLYKKHGFQPSNRNGAFLNMHLTL